MTSTIVYKPGDSESAGVSVLLNNSNESIYWCGKSIVMFCPDGTIYTWWHKSSTAEDTFQSSDPAQDDNQEICDNCGDECDGTYRRFCSNDCRYEYMENTMNYSD